MPNDTITFTADYSTSTEGFKMCRSLVQVTANVTQVPTTQINPAPSSFNEFWGVADGGCYLDTSGCINSPNYPLTYFASETCEIHITDSWNGGTLLFADFETEDWDSLHVNGEGYSGKGLDVVDKLQGLVPTSRIFWSADGNTEEKRWKVCQRRQSRPSGTIGHARCLELLAPISHSTPQMPALTQYSDEDDVDADGDFHTGHPYCMAPDSTEFLVKTPCGPCSCSAGEEQTTVSRTLGTGWNQYEYIVCEPCSPSKYSSEGGSECQSCAPGYYSSVSGQSVCDVHLAHLERVFWTVKCVLWDFTLRYQAK